MAEALKLTHSATIALHFGAEPDARPYPLLSASTICVVTGGSPAATELKNYDRQY